MTSESRGPRASTAWLVTVTLVLAACGGAPRNSPIPSGTASGSGSGPNLSAAEAELDHALQQLEAIHPEPFHAVPRQAFVAELESLKASLPDLTPDQAMVGLMRLWARLSVERDGHQFAFLAEDRDEPVLPLRVYEFEEGVFITAAMDEGAKLAGTRLVSLGGHPIDEVLAALEPLVPRDGPATLPAFRPIYLLKVAVLRGLGLVGEGDVELEVDDGGQARTVSVAPVPVAEFEAWAGWLAYTGLPPREGLRATEQRDASIWIEHLPEGAIYLRYPAVRDIPTAVIDELDAMAAEHPDERVIVDLRQNPGGDNHNYVTLLSHLMDAEIDRPGRLLVLTDRVTFSAAANFATEIEQKTQARFVGEPPGGGLNFWDDVTWEHLDDYVVPMRVAISVRYWEKSTPDDPRLTIEPDLAVATRAADYFAGRDPVLEAPVRLPPP
ncbi:MAG TPA: hypothetical protein VFY43_04590 [Candidatus Limnocylindria bacterium]|nr:hypothetical protein [Candidatus Limnocylindria bacterium]